MRTRRSRRIDAPREAVWSVVADPYHLPRWWPKVQRVEGVTDDAWTAVFATAKGRTVRADYLLVEREEPAIVAWEQELVGTPFERVLTRSAYVLRLSDRDGGAGTDAVLEWDQGLRGFARFGGLMVRRAAGKMLDEALDGLSAAVSGP